MYSLLKFLKYNNIVPVAVSFLLLGAASTFAYTNPEVLVEKQEALVSIDNTYIAEKNLKRFSPEVEILSVEEDDTHYFVTYEFTTIALKDAVWQDVTTTEVMQIEKTRLGEYRDLGLYVTGELNELIKTEKKRLSETQTIEKKQKTTKKVVTKYKGIVGGFLSEDVTNIPKYKPVIKQPKPKQEVETFARPPANPPKKDSQKVLNEPVVELNQDPVEETSDESEAEEETSTENAEEPVASSTEDSASTTEETVDDSGSGTSEPEEPANEAPYLTILGDNPVELEVGEQYTDLGATVTDDADTGLTVIVYVNGQLVDRVEIDTSTTSTHSIVYEATDSEGETSRVERVVSVVRVTPQEPPVTEDTDSEDVASSTVDTADSAPAIENKEETEPEEGEPEEPSGEVSPHASSSELSQ